MTTEAYTREQVLEILELQRNASKSYGITNILDMYNAGVRAESICLSVSPNDNGDIQPRALNTNQQ